MNNNINYPPPPPSNSHTSRHTPASSNTSMNPYGQQSSQNFRSHTIDSNSIVSNLNLNSSKTYISNVSIYDRNLRLTKDSGTGYNSSKKNDSNRDKDKEKVSLSIFALLFWKWSAGR